MSVFAQILMDAYYLVYNVSCDDAFGCTVYFNSLSVYRKSTKIKKNSVLVHYIIFPSLIQTILSISMCGLTFFRLSCPLQVPHPLHWTIKVGQSRYQRFSLTRYRLPDSQESPVWKSNSNRRKVCRGQRYVSQSANCPNSLVNILTLYHIQGCP